MEAALRAVWVGGAWTEQARWQWKVGLVVVLQQTRGLWADAAPGLARWLPEKMSASEILGWRPRGVSAETGRGKAGDAVGVSAETGARRRGRPRRKKGGMTRREAWMREKVRRWMAGEEEMPEVWKRLWEAWEG